VGVGRWGDRVADYAKGFHNIRRLKFSHNIQPRAGRHDGAKKEERGAQQEEEEEEEEEQEEEEEVRTEACVALGVLG